MKISVIVCTYNRARFLNMALERMGRLQVSAALTWELLVVSNGPPQATDRVVERFRHRLPLRRLHEERPGKSHALNRALRDARGEYLVFTDDDVLVDAGWLVAYCSAFDRWPAVAFFGGPITASFEGTPPRWLIESRDQLGGVYAERDFGPDSVPLTADLVPFGANLAIRADDHARYRYPTSLGPTPGDMVRGEDTAVVRAMLADDLTGRWVPDARVRHVIPPERQTIRYVRRYFVGHGRQCATQERDDPGPRWWGRPRWVWRAAIEATVRYAMRRPGKEAAVRVADLIAASIAWGRLRGPRPAEDLAVRIGAGGTRS